ncbi:MAG: alpha/beta fold hydrolase [Bacteroidota bacterium]
MILHTKIYGEGTPLIILHGLLGSLDNWQSIAKYWGQRFQVITMDARNHGRSIHIDTFSYTIMMQDVIDTMNHLQIAKAIFVGHSMGGKTAMYLALHHPERILKLAVIDIAPIDYEAHHEDVFKALHAVPIEHIQERKEAEQIIAQYVAENDVIQFLMKGLYRKEDNSFAWRFNVKDLYNSYDNILSFETTSLSYSGDVIFIKGSKSKYIQTKDEVRIQTYFPNAQIESIEDAGHWVHAEKPKEFLQIMDLFLAS